MAGVIAEMDDRERGLCVPMATKAYRFLPTDHRSSRDFGGMLKASGR
jgi:hypothetical protein